MQGLLRHVNLLQGTDSVHDFSTGNTLPLAGRPWGLHHWCLQTARSPWAFHPAHSRLWGFRLTHQPSPWLRDYASLTLQPFTGACTPEFEHQNSAYRVRESVLAPNYLQADLLRYGIRAQMSPSERGALFVFLKHGDAALKVRFEFEGDFEINARTGDCRVTGCSRNVRAETALPRFGLHFLARLSAPVTGFQRTAQGAFIEFAPEIDRVELRLAASFINQDIAEISYWRELARHSLDSLRDEGAQTWEDLLGRVRIQARSAEQEATFYSCLYRCLLFPRFLDEVDARGRTVHYSPYDDAVHEGSLCTDSGFWDGYRTLYPLLALVYPDVLNRMMEGWLNACRQTGWTPKWPSPGPRDCMIGTHFDAVVADAVVKGVTDWDVEAVYPYLWRNATDLSGNGLYGRAGLGHYLERGYVAADQARYAVSATLDYAYDDFCVSQVADYLGRPGEARQLRVRAGNYRKVFDHELNFMRARTSDGGWLTPFREFEWGGPYVEGGPWQHAFNVPHDFPGLSALYGGERALCARLDAMLRTPPRFEVGHYGFEIHEMTEMALADFGQYAHSNQPVHGFLFLYALAGEPAKTEHWVKRVLTELYSADRFPGDEDNGEMGAWYVFATLGLYPHCPGKAEYVHFAPSVSAASLHLSGGDVIELSPERLARTAAGNRVITHQALLNPLREPALLSV
jgi:predicted alpha-1,2-mannosidase